MELKISLGNCFGGTTFFEGCKETLDKLCGNSLYDHEELCRQLDANRDGFDAFLAEDGLVLRPSGLVEQSDTAGCNERVRGVAAGQAFADEMGCGDPLKSLERSLQLYNDRRNYGTGLRPDQMKKPRPKAETNVDNWEWGVPVAIAGIALCALLLIPGAPVAGVRVLTIASKTDTVTKIAAGLFLGLNLAYATLHDYA